MGKLLAIANKYETKGKMNLFEEAFVNLETGVEKDLRGAVNNRQVTVVSKESWDATCAELGKELDWTARRANLLIEGIELTNNTGKILSIGNEVTIEITNELKPCNRMDENYTGLQEALAPDWRGGVTCKILNGGNIKVGDEVCLS
ncbi:MAG: MOSC domain-containing protein [Bacteroidia bacterium]|nr:MOSC domain-containing protein [Bacteroidia bacterium]